MCIQNHPFMISKIRKKKQRQKIRAKQKKSDGQKYEIVDNWQERRSGVDGKKCSFTLYNRVC